MLPNEALTSLPSAGPPTGEAAPAPRPACRFAPLRALARWCAAGVVSLARRPGRALTVGGLLALIAVGMVAAGTQLYARYQFRAARSCVEHCHSVEARQHLAFCLWLWPHDPSVLLLAARNARRREAFDQAEQFLDRYQREHGSSDDLTLERALLRAERGEMDVVSKYCWALVDRKDPATPLVLEALAHGYLRAYRLREAGFCLQVWEREQPDNAQQQLLFGEGYDLRGRREDAIARFRRALEIDHDLDPARRHLAWLLLTSARPEEALPDLQYLLRRQPDDPQARVYLAQCQDQLGHEAEAVRLLDEVLAGHPNYPPALAQRGTLALRDGDTAAAENWLRQATSLDPGESQTHYQFWQCLVRLGKSAEAEKEHERLKQLVEDEKHFQELLTRLQEAPHDPAAQYELGLIAFRAGSTRDGLRWLESALAADPHYAPAHRALASYYQQAGESARAARHRRLADEAAADKHEPAGT